jgi:hypothetical protein
VGEGGGAGKKCKKWGLKSTVEEARTIRNGRTVLDDESSRNIENRSQKMDLGRHGSKIENRWRFELLKMSPGRKEIKIDLRRKDSEYGVFIE